MNDTSRGALKIVYQNIVCEIECILITLFYLSLGFLQDGFPKNSNGFVTGTRRVGQKGSLGRSMS